MPPCLIQTPTALIAQEMASWVWNWQYYLNTLHRIRNIVTWHLTMLSVYLSGMLRYKDLGDNEGRKRWCVCERGVVPRLVSVKYIHCKWFPFVLFRNDTTRKYTTTLLFIAVTKVSFVNWIPAMIALSHALCAHTLTSKNGGMSSASHRHSSGRADRLLTDLLQEGILHVILPADSSEYLQDAMNIYEH